MKETGKHLVNKYGPGAADGIDNYYHALLQCELAKISPRSRNNGLKMGIGKEAYDYWAKSDSINGNLSTVELMNDIVKDMNNNNHDLR